MSPLLVLLLSLLVACSAPEEKALAKYAGATLTAGTGLGDLVLGETTLDWFIHHVGKGRFSMAVSDDSGFEFDFHDQQIAFQFLIRGACDRQIWASRDMRSATRDLEAYLTRHPACREVTLSSISVAKGRGLHGTFFQGATDKGVKLGSPITAAFPHGETKNTLARMMAGLSPGNPEDSIEYRGILFYYDRGSSDDVADTVIERMTIFVEDE